MVGVFSLLPLSFARPLRRELEKSDVIVPACQNEMGTSCCQCRKKWECYGKTFMDIRGLYIFLDRRISRDCGSVLIPVKVKPHVETSPTASNLNNYQLITLLVMIRLKH